jgi:hypothetical protein
MQIRPVGAGCYMWTDGQTDIKKLILQTNLKMVQTVNNTGIGIA